MRKSALLIHNSIVGPDVGSLCFLCSQAKVVVAAEQQKHRYPISYRAPLGKQQQVEGEPELGQLSRLMGILFLQVLLDRVLEVAVSFCLPQVLRRCIAGIPNDFPAA